MYPHYNKIAAEKLKCRPGGVKVGERMAKVPLGFILPHTAERIVEMQKEVFELLMETENSSYLKSELILSYGFDSSTGHAQFNQVFEKPCSLRGSDGSHWATTIIGLKKLF